MAYTAHLAITAGGGPDMNGGRVRWMSRHIGDGKGMRNAAWAAYVEHDDIAIRVTDLSRLDGAPVRTMGTAQLTPQAEPSRRRE